MILGCCMRTSRIPSGIDDCRGLGVTESLVGDVGIRQSGATLELPVSQRILVIAVLGHAAVAVALVLLDQGGTLIDKTAR